MTLNDLYARAERQNIAVDDVPMRAIASASFPQGWIALDSSKIESQAAEKVTLAHELGHIETGSFYNIYSPFDLRAKHERHADRRAIQMLVPNDALINAIKGGITEPWELAEYFEVTESFIRKAMLYYQTK